MDLIVMNIQDLPIENYCTGWIPPRATPSVKIQILNMAENIKKTTNLSVVYEIFSILRTRLQN